MWARTDDFPRGPGETGKRSLRRGDQVPAATRQERQPQDGIGHDTPSKAERRYADEKSKVSLALFASFMAILLSIAALLGVAFRIDDNTTTPTSASSDHAAPASTPLAPAVSAAPADASSAGRLRVGMGDYFFSPAAATATAGKLSLSAVNRGKLPTLPDGSVNEEALKSPGEIPDVAAGATKSTNLDLQPGRYVMFCNLPGHYAAGMFGTLVVR
jgi:plastocyanin